MPLLLLADTGAVPSWLGVLGGGLFAVWFGYHVVTRTIPTLVESFCEEMQAERVFHSAEMKLEREFHAVTLDRLFAEIKGGACRHPSGEGKS